MLIDSHLNSESCIVIHAISFFVEDQKPKKGNIEVLVHFIFLLKLSEIAKFSGSSSFEAVGNSQNSPSEALQRNIEAVVEFVIMSGRNSILHYFLAWC